MSGDNGAALLVLGVAPNPQGVGVEQRAARTLLALAQRGPVHVLWYGPRRSERAVSPAVRALGASWTDVRPPRRAADLSRWLRRIYLRVPRTPPPPRGLSPLLRKTFGLEGVAPALDAPPPALASLRFRAVHGFRLTSAPLALSCRSLAPFVSLDVDDLESDTLDDIARLASQEGDEGFAWLMREQSSAAARFEASFLGRVERIGCCSEADAQSLRARFPGARAFVLPNAVAAPAALPPPRARAAGDRLRLLVVGALGYYPNVDAVRFLAREVLPELRGRLDRPVELHVVGRGAGLPLRRFLARCPGVVFHGGLARLDAVYDACDVSLCAIRAGGGTRIKILEAFAQRLPLVSTRRGANGLAVTAGEQLLFAETSTQFVDAILHIAHNAGVPDMVDRAYRFVAQAHAEGSFDRALHALTSQES